MKVYVVTQGSYSDYHISGVAIDRETAELIKARCYDDPEIEEYDTDDFTPLKDRRPYRVGIPKAGAISVKLIETLPGSPGKVFEYKWGHIVDVYAKDEDHALKIAFDKVAEYKAEKKGVI